MDPNAPNDITPEEYQLILQWRQQQQQQQQAPPPPTPQQLVASQSQPASMWVSQRMNDMADNFFQSLYNNAGNQLWSQAQQAPPPPPPPEQQVAFQSQHAPMSTDQIFGNMADQLRQTFYNDAVNQLQSEVQAYVNQGRNDHTPPQYGGGPSQVQQPQFIQPQGFTAPQYGGGSFGPQQPQSNQPQGFVARQYGGGPSQVQQPQFNQQQGFTAPKYGGAPFGTQQPHYNQPQSFAVPQLMAPPVPAPQQPFPPAEGHSFSAFDGNRNPALGEEAVAGNQSPPVKRESEDENNGTNASPPIKLESEDGDNGASRSIETRFQGRTGRNGSPSQTRSTGAQRRERRRRACAHPYTRPRRGEYQ